jgi:bacteriocin biosynthesis cyclodehydratase domain-containing protein
MFRFARTSGRLIGAVLRRYVSWSDLVKNSGELPSAGGTLELVHPKLLHDSIFLPAEDGIFFRSRNRKFILHQPGSYELMSQLAPLLSGTMTMDEICASFTSDLHTSIQLLIRVLLEQKIVIDHVQETSGLGQPILDAFRAQIEFIEHCATQPVARFERFRRSRILVAGSGVPLRSLAISLMRNGLETVVFDPSMAELDADGAILEVQRQLQVQGVSIALERAALKELLASGQPELAAIGYAADASDPREMLAINELCCRLPVALVPGFLFGGKAMVGPLVHSDFSGCWLCAILRHAGCVEASTEAWFWKCMALGNSWESDCRLASSASLRILGNMVGFELFRFLTGHISPETRGFVLSQSLETLETSRSRLLPHPFCPHCSMKNSDASRNTPQKNVSRDSLSLQQRLTRLCRLIDSQLGIAKGYEDKDLPQIPLFRTSLVVSRQLRLVEGSLPGYSIESNMHARLNALMEAVRFYSVTLIDPRRMVTEADDAPSPRVFIPIQSSQLSGWMGGPAATDDHTCWMRAQLLGATMGQEYLVPAAAVFTQAPLNQGTFEKVDTGIGAGFTLEEAGEDAARALLAHEMLKSIAKNDATLAEIDLPYLSAANADVRYLDQCFTQLHIRIRMLGSCHRLGYSVVLSFIRGDSAIHKKIAVGAAQSLEQAVVQSMTELLAISVGDRSLHTLNRYLPGSLGYCLDLPDNGAVQKSASIPGPTEKCLTSTPGEVEQMSGRILLVELTPPDLSSCGLFVVKALLANGGVAPL